MAKPGRNDPCHCGSGKKYKKCCQPKEQAAEGEVIAKEQAARSERAAARRVEERQARAAFLERFAEAYEVDEELEELTTASNAAVDLVNAGKLKEAEAAARDLIARYPDVHDGWDRLGMMYEAKGDNKAAADCYRRAARGHPRAPSAMRSGVRPGVRRSRRQARPAGGRAGGQLTMAIALGNGAEPPRLYELARNPGASPRIAGRG